MGFAPGGADSVLLHLTEDEQQILTSLLYSVLEALAEPEDPEAGALRQRWFPEAYPDDPEATERFRANAQADLTQTKRANAAACLSTLDAPADDGTRVLGAEEATAWALALNDVRLALGTGLGIGADEDEPPADDEDRAPALDLYDWLTWLQETLVRSLP
jgi:hypothetical protein